MITALNMTVPLKQDPESLAKLQQLKALFADHIQPEIDRALRKSKIVHHARVLVIHDRFLQVITEFDGDPEEYTEFFRRELPHVFKPIFELAEGAPPWDELNDQDSFFEASKHLNVKALGRSEDGREEQGWLFSYFPGTVREIEESLSGGGESENPAPDDAPPAPAPVPAPPAPTPAPAPAQSGGANAAALHAAAAALHAAAAALTAAAGGAAHGG
jgi:pyruvate/2-oxoglutarate dehydrogenase complex dihydrolipoamide acyltransferase (E2) component